MIVKTLAGQHYRVTETGHPDLAHCWNGIAVKLTKGRWEPKARRFEVLVAKAGTVQIAAE